MTEGEGIKIARKIKNQTKSNKINEKRADQKYLNTTIRNVLSDSRLNSINYNDSVET